MDRPPIQMPSRDVLAAEEVRRDFALFLRGAFRAMHGGRDPVWGWHLDLICEELQALKEGRKDRQVVCVPPGSMKSFSASVALPAWWLLPGNDPSMSFLAVSNGESFAVRDSVKCRDLILSDWYQDLKTRLEQLYPEDVWTLKGDQNQKSKFQTTRGGFRQCMGINTNVTGVRARCIILDDVIDAKDAIGDATQVGQRMSRVREKLAQAVESRLEPASQTCILSIQQRLHVDDPAGWHKSRGWPTLVIPAEYQPDHPDIDPRDPRTEPGELMCPDLITAETIAEFRAANAGFEHVYAAQYQQLPYVPEGGLFRREDWQVAPRASFPAMSEFDMIVAGVDLAFKGTLSSDYCVVYVIGRKGGRFWVLHRERHRYEYSQQREMIRRIAADWNPHAIAIEDAATGAPIVSELRDEIPGIEPLRPAGHKSTRAQAWLAPVQRAGQITLPEDAEWVPDALAQFTQFPHGSNDDDIDALGLAVHYARTRVAVALDASAVSVMSDAAGWF